MKLLRNEKNQQELHLRFRQFGSSFDLEFTDFNGNLIATILTIAENGIFRKSTEVRDSLENSDMDLEAIQFEENGAVKIL